MTFRKLSFAVSQVSLLTKTRAADEKQKSAAEEFDDVKIFSKVLIELRICDPRA